MIEASRDTRPPSSSTLTPSGSAVADPAIPASGAPSIERSVQLPIMMPPTLCSATAACASAAPVTPTISSWASLSRVDSDAMSPHTAGAGAAGNGLSREAKFGAKALLLVAAGGAAASVDWAGEQATSSPDSAVTAQSVRGIDMGPDTSGYAMVASAAAHTAPVAGRQNSRSAAVVATF